MAGLAASCSRLNELRSIPSFLWALLDDLILSILFSWH